MTTASLVVAGLLAVGLAVNTAVRVMERRATTFARVTAEDEP
jgi:hypothetical protein